MEPGRQTIVPGPIRSALVALLAGSGRSRDCVRTAQDPNACEGVAVSGPAIARARAGSGGAGDLGAIRSARQRWLWPGRFSRQYRAAKFHSRPPGLLPGWPERRTWLAKFRISNAIDAGKPLPARLRRKLERDPELRAFAETTARIERGLRQSPEPELPPCAHDAIMRAIKAAQPQPRATAPFQLKWLPVAGCAALMMIGVWWLARPAPRPAPHLARTHHQWHPGARLANGAGPAGGGVVAAQRRVAPAESRLGQHRSISARKPAVKQDDGVKVGGCIADL